MFARETPVGCGRINKTDAANTCFCCGSVPICIYGFWFMTKVPGYISSANSFISAQLSVSFYFNLLSISFLCLFFLYPWFFPMGIPQPFLIELSLSFVLNHLSLSKTHKTLSWSTSGWGPGSKKRLQVTLVKPRFHSRYPSCFLMSVLLLKIFIYSIFHVLTFFFSL